MQPLKNYVLSNQWQKATIIGSVWGAFEIVAGSLLHNLTVPLVAGTTLSALGVIILVAGARVFGGKGIFWRAALVCAALKTVSPSPIILSPMIGITLEGFLMEAGVLLLGGNLFGYMLGGGLALVSVLGFKFVRLIMIYGIDLVEAYQSFFRLAFSNELLSAKGYLIPLIVFILLYLAIGLIVAFVGFRGGNAIKDRFHGKKIQFLPLENGYKPPTIEGYKGGIGFLLFHIFWLIFFILTKDYLGSIFWLSAGMVYILLCIFRYGRVRSLLSGPMFWIVITMVSTISTIFISIGNYGSLFLNLGFFELCITIIIRASVVIISFLSISIELRSKGVSQRFSNNFFSPLVKSFEHAQGSIPGLLSTLKKETKQIYKPLPIIEKMFTQFATPDQLQIKHKPVYIVTTGKHSGKTTFIKELALYLETSGVEISGFYSESIRNNKQQSIGYNLITIPKRQSIPLCNRSTNHWEPYGSYFFNPFAIKKANDVLKDTSDKAVVIIDEIGLFELEGNLWADSFSKLLVLQKNHIVIAVRNAFIEEIEKKWGLTDVVIIDATSEYPEDLGKLIISRNR